MARAGCSGARLTRRRRLRRRQSLSQSAGGAAFAGKVGSRVGREDQQGARGGGRARGGARGHALSARDRPTHSHARNARETPAGRGREAVGGPLPPSLPPLTLTRKWCCSSCSREPRFLHAPSLPPSPQQTQSRAAAERRRERRKRKGGREGNGNAGGAVMGKGGECKGRVTSGSGRAYPALPALRDAWGRSYDK